MGPFIPPNIRKMYDLNPTPLSFYSNSAITVARALLGNYLYSCRGQLLGRIVETEAYPGDDPINHGIKKKTKRNAAMFLPPRYCYIYYVYYKNLCFNISVEKEGIPSVILIRAVEPLEGFKTINLTNGPSKLCKSFGITILDNGKELCKTHLSIYTGLKPEFEMVETSRIGVKEDFPKLYRFYIKDNQFVSKKKN